MSYSGQELIPGPSEHETRLLATGLQYSMTMMMMMMMMMMMIIIIIIIIINAGKLLNSCTTGGFSRRAQLHVLL
jgi:uncharacterized membrane protein